MSTGSTGPGDSAASTGRYEHILSPRAPIHGDALRLASFLADLQYEEIPADVLHTAKLITLDTIGCIVAGAETSLGLKILTAYDSGAGSSGCVVPGTSLRVPSSLAAKINAWLSDVLDYEDVASGHPSATVIPAALAMAEHLDATPQKYLAGVVAGYEAGLRVHDATRATPERYRQLAVYHAWHGVAAGAAAMGVSGGSDEQFRSALGHAAANTSVPLWYVQYGRPAHALKANYGQMALGGVDAALCARQDIIGPFAMLSDAERGFAQMIGSDRFEPSELSAGLGSTWRTRESSIKAYPSCGFLHTTIDAVSSLVTAHTIDHQDIDRVRIRTFDRISEWFSDPKPSSETDGQLSVQYVTAMAVMSVEPGRGWYAPALMTDARVLDLMTKIDVEVDPVAEEAFWAGDGFFSSVRISLTNGQTVEATAELPPGHWRRPLSDSDVERKFLSNVSGTALEKRGAEIVERTMDMDSTASLDGLLSILGVARA